MYTVQDLHKQDICFPEQKFGGQVGKTANLNLVDIRTSYLDNNSARVFNFIPENAMNIKKSFQMHGYVTTSELPIVQKIGNNYELLAGRHRFHALRELDVEIFPFTVFENLDNMTRSQIEVATNVPLPRLPMKDVDLAQNVIRLIESGDLEKNEDEIRIYLDDLLIHEPQIKRVIKVVRENEGGIRSDWTTFDKQVAKEWAKFAKGQYRNLVYGRPHHNGQVYYPYESGQIDRGLMSGLKLCAKYPNLQVNMVSFLRNNKSKNFKAERIAHQKSLKKVMEMLEGLGLSADNLNFNLYFPQHVSEDSQTLVRVN